MINSVPTKSLVLSAEIERQTAEFLRNGGEIVAYDSSANANRAANLAEFSINKRSGTGKKTKPVKPQ